MNARIDEDLFEIFSNSFFGFGTYRAPLWFIGPYADLLGAEPTEIARRLEFWHRRGQPALVDLGRFQRMMGVPSWSGEQPRLHRIWGRLARICLASEGRRIDEQVRAFQAGELGSTAGRSAILHVLPVECRPSERWPYEALETAHLKQPNLYSERFADRRLLQLSHLIKRYQPPAVVFYDLTHRAWWERVVLGPFTRTRVRDCFSARSEATRYLMVRHPESVGTRNEYFDEVGHLAAESVADPVP